MNGLLTAVQILIPVLAVLGLVFLWLRKRSTRNAVTYFSFEAEGVTGQNSDGSDRQKILSDIRSQLKGHRMNLRECEDNGSPALAILINEKQIGVVPAECVNYLFGEMDKGTLLSGECEFLPADGYIRVKITIAVSSDPNQIPDVRPAWREVIPQYRPYDSDLLPDSYVVFDLETSGLDPAKYEIIEIGAIRFEGGHETGQYHTYVKPVSPVPSQASGINGITNEMLRSAPSFDEISADFVGFLKDLPLVAHNARFDMHFLQTELKRRLENQVIDTLKLSRELIPGLENYKLETLKQYFGMDVGSHNALDDCLVAAKVYQECIPLAKERWLQSRPLIDKAIPDDAKQLSGQAQTYYQAIRKILQENGKNTEDIHVLLFKNGKDFAVNISNLRLFKVVFLKKETYIAMECSESEVREILDTNGFQYRQDASSDIYKIVLPGLESIKTLSPVICRCFDKIRAEFQ